MLLFAHYVEKSLIHGLGVFAAEAIKKGTLIWRFNPLLDRKIPINEYLELPSHAQQWVRRHSEFFPTDNCFVLAGDGNIFMNHSFDANLLWDFHDGYAFRDIAIGEEVTCDYRFVKTLDFEPELQSLLAQNFETAFK